MLMPEGWEPGVMGPISRTVLGDSTPGFTTPGKTRFNEKWLVFATAEFIGHEATHDWEMRFRMGRVSGVATYLWHVVLTGCDHQHHTGADAVVDDVHTDHMQEVVARQHGRAMQAEVLLRDAGSVYDVQAYLEREFPKLPRKWWNL